MKNFKLLALFAFLLSFGFTACNNEGSAAKDAARESLATTSTTAPASSATPTVNTKPAEPAAPVGPLTSIKFEEDSYDFGEIMEGEKVVHVYKFENTGKEPLVISNAKGSCGCTVPDWPREAIAPGETAEMKVTYDTKRTGAINKSVTITSNAGNTPTKVVRIKGTVKAKAVPAN